MSSRGSGQRRSRTSKKTENQISKEEAKAWNEDCAKFVDWWESEGKFLPPTKVSDSAMRF